jgi:hypothetical protein
MKTVTATLATVLPPATGATFGALLAGPDEVLAAGLGAAGLVIGLVVALLLRPRVLALPPRVGRFNTQLASLTLAALAAASSAGAVWLTARGPQRLAAGARPRAASYVEARGTPDRRYLYRGDGLFRFPLQEHDPRMLVESTSAPGSASIVFRGSISAIIIGGSVGSEHRPFALEYADRRRVGGTIYILKASRLLSPNILIWAGAAAFMTLALVVFFRRAAAS